MMMSAARRATAPSRNEQSESEVLTADPLLIVLLRVLTEHCSGSDRIRRRGGSAGAMRTVR